MAKTSPLWLPSDAWGLILPNTRDEYKRIFKCVSKTWYNILSKQYHDLLEKGVDLSKWELSMVTLVKCGRINLVKWGMEFMHPYWKYDHELADWALHNGYVGIYNLLINNSVPPRLKNALN